SNIYNFLQNASASQATAQIVNTSMAAQLDALFKSYIMYGFSYSNTPRIFSMAFSDKHRILNGPVIDNLALSEKRLVQKIGDGDHNYLEWLATSKINYIRAENFLNVSTYNVNPPKALLYL